MRSRILILLLSLCAALTITGCGGGLTLTGGSVPTGGRAVTGSAVLPGGLPVAAAQVTVKSLPSGNTIQTAVTDSSGKFNLTGISTSSDISIIINQPPSNLLEAVVPRANLAANPGQTLDIGQVTALTTLVAAALHLEHQNAPEDSEHIVSNQEDYLIMQVHDAGYSLDDQKQFVGDPQSLMAQALTLIGPVANIELAAFNAAPGQMTAETALDGLLGYVRAAHDHEFHLSDNIQNGLITAQITGKIYSMEKIAAALQSAGVTNATSVEVSSASQRERAELPALITSNGGITAFEALIITVDLRTNGGFQLDQMKLDRFLNILLLP